MYNIKLIIEYLMNISTKPKPVEYTYIKLFILQINTPYYR